MITEAFPTSLRLAFRAGMAVMLLAGLGGAPALARQGDDEPQVAHTLLGSYLAGRIARGQHDSEGAARYYQAALERDPKNEPLIEQSLIMETTEGRFDAAIGLAKRLIETQPDHRMARLVLGIDAAKRGQYAEAQQHFTASGKGVMERLTLALARSWMMVAQGNAKGAVTEAGTINQAEWARFYVRYHQALMLDVGGQRVDAAKVYQRIFRRDAKSFRVTLAYAHHASSSGNAKLASTILNKHTRLAGGSAHPVTQRLLEQLKAGETLELLIKTPEQGLAEIFYGLGEALASEGGIGVGAIYLQMALHLEPRAPFALAALANVHETTKSYEKAIAAYNRIPLGTALQHAIDIRKAQNLNNLDRVDEAKTLLEGLAASEPTDKRALDALGTLMRGRKRFEEAIGYYDRVIALITKPERKDWTYYYARGTSYERTKNWPKAEEDLKFAMQLSPDQALILNYLGYSWVDQNVHLRQGLKLIERAVQLKPDDGYIVDSLGWAHFRLGNFKEAVKYLERAVELKPEDPTLNDHLGDAFWRVGRQREANFQWTQALTLKPEPEEIPKIEAKLANGLPDAPPPAAADPAKNKANGSGGDADVDKRADTRVRKPQVQ